MAKRERERQFQAWFDPEDPNDLEVLQVNDFFRDPQKAGQKFTQKDVIAMAYRALAKNRRPDLLLPRENEQTMLIRAMSLLDAMSQQISTIAQRIETGQFIGITHAVETAQRLQDEFGELEQSIAGGYKALSFEDDD
jgi:hypothetical protein